jgi:formylglycine-generating enzyme required for sulfatase activity
MVTPISKAMAVSRKQRYETVSSFLNDLNGETNGTIMNSKTDNTVIANDSTSSSQSKPDLESKALQHPETSGNDGKGRTKLNWALLILVAVFIVMIVLSLNFYGEGSTSPFPDVSGKSYTVNGVTFEMIKVEGGSFQMGGDVFADETPIHTETITSFQIGKTEVTQALWKAVMGDNPSYFSGDDLPVENVSWDDCQIFISKLNEMPANGGRVGVCCTRWKKISWL